MSRHRGTRALPAASRPVVDGWVLLAAVLISAPAGYRLSQGLVSVTDVLVRFLLVTTGCALAFVLVRHAWAAIVGAPAEADPAPVDAGASAGGAADGT